MAIAQNFPAIAPSLSLDFAAVQALDPRITFTRASTATYYGTETAKAEENLFLQSNTFSTAWAADAGTLTTGLSGAPDGTSTAVKLTAIISQNRAAAFKSTTTTVLLGQQAYTASCFFKADTSNFVYIAIGRFLPSAFDSGTVIFDLSTGAATQTQGTISSSIVAVGNGWYRCSVTYSLPLNTTQIRTLFGLAAAATENTFNASQGFVDNLAATGTEAVFMWGQQLEQRDAVTAYTPTTTQPITNYIPVLESAASGVARFDHNPTTFESLGLLIEESRTNLLLRSEEFDNAGWTKTRSSIEANTIVAPSGELTGDKLVENTDNNTHTISQSVTLTAAASTISFYAKAGGRNFVSVINNTISNAAANFDLSNGTLGTIGAAATASIQSVGNGWHRCSMTFTAAAGTNQFLIRLGSADNSPSYTGNGFDGIYIWGAQLEAGAFPTSFIPTVASQVTRAADAASMTGANFSSWYNQGAGTLYAEASAAAPAETAQVFGISDGTVSNRVVSSSTNISTVFVAVSGVVQASLNTSVVAPNTSSKVGVAFAVNDIAVVRSGGAAVTDTTALIPVVNRMFIGNGALGSGATLNGHIRKLSYYPQRLSNINLVALTS